jgi:hypothetical protein
MARGRRGQATPVVYSEEAEYTSLLTEAERRKIEAQVDEEIREIQIEEERSRYREAFRAQRRVQAGLEEEQEEVIIDVAGHADRITLDGKRYWQGHAYTVPAGVAATLRDIEHRTWEHEWSVGGANANEYRKPLHTRVFSGTQRGQIKADNAPASPAALAALRPLPQVRMNTAKGFRSGRGQG